MPDLIDEEPAVIVKKLLETQWDSTNIDGTFDHTKRISTGWWNEDNPHPQITVTPVDEDTSYTGINPATGNPTSWVDGALDVNVWVAHDYDATGGIHPRTHRWQLRLEVQWILGANSEGTTDENGNPQLTRLEPGRIRGDVEDDENPVVYRYIIPVLYQWHARY